MYQFFVLIYSILFCSIICYNNRLSWSICKAKFVFLRWHVVPDPPLFTTNGYDINSRLGIRRDSQYYDTTTASTGGVACATLKTTSSSSSS